MESLRQEDMDSSSTSITHRMLVFKYHELGGLGGLQKTLHHHTCLWTWITEATPVDPRGIQWKLSVPAPQTLHCLPWAPLLVMNRENEPPPPPPLLEATQYALFWSLCL